MLKIAEIVRKSLKKLHWPGSEHCRKARWLPAKSAGIHRALLPHAPFAEDRSGLHIVPPPYSDASGGGFGGRPAPPTRRAFKPGRPPPCSLGPRAIARASPPVQNSLHRSRLASLRRQTAATQRRKFRANPARNDAENAKKNTTKQTRQNAQIVDQRKCPEGSEIGVINCGHVAIKLRPPANCDPDANPGATHLRDVYPPSLPSLPRDNARYPKAARLPVRGRKPQRPEPGREPQQLALHVPRRRVGDHPCAWRMAHGDGPQSTKHLSRCPWLRVSPTLHGKLFLLTLHGITRSVLL